MERRLILMRHAKSSWKTNAPSDHARPLNGRGKRDAPRVAARLQDDGWTPDAVFSSTSKRTRQTWKRMREVFDDGEDINVEWVPDFYHGGLDDLRAAAADWPDGLGTVLVLGHNPGWEEALGELIEGEEPMTTGNAALLAGRGATWADALSKRWRLTDLIRPRELEDD